MIYGSSEAEQAQFILKLTAPIIVTLAYPQQEQVKNGDTKSFHFQKFVVDSLITPAFVNVNALSIILEIEVTSPKQRSSKRNHIQTLAFKAYLVSEVRSTSRPTQTLEMSQLFKSFLLLLAFAFQRLIHQ